MSSDGESEADEALMEELDNVGIEARVRLQRISTNMDVLVLMKEVIRSGDLVEVTTSYREPAKVYTFLGFNPHLFLLKLKDEYGNTTFIKYDQVKMLKLLKK